MARLVSKVYGEALFEFAKDNNQLEKMYEEALDIIDVFNCDNSVASFLSSPNTTNEQKIDFIHNLFVDRFWSGQMAKEFKLFSVNTAKGVDPKIIDFLAIIINKGRQKELVAILKYFIHLVLQDKNIGEADVFSATTLSDEQKKET